MSNLDTSLDRAHKVKGPEQAARLYADIDTELGLGEYTEDQADTGERALRHLEENYPGVRSNSFAKVENGHLPNLSRSAKGNLDREAGEPREESENAHPKEEGWGPELERDRRRRRAANRTRVTRARSQPRRARRVGRTIYQGTRAAGAVESTTQLILKALGGLAGISFLYLLLQPKGVAAIQTGAGGVNHALSALISPSVDPLRSTTADIANPVDICPQKRAVRQGGGMVPSGLLQPPGRSSSR